MPFVSITDPANRAPRFSDYSRCTFQETPRQEQPRRVSGVSQPTVRTCSPGGKGASGSDHHPNLRSFRIAVAKVDWRTFPPTDASRFVPPRCSLSHPAVLRPQTDDRDEHTILYPADARQDVLPILTEAQVFAGMCALT